MSKKLNIQIAQIEAIRFGGECLSANYVNIDDYLKWKCKNGHIFEKSLYDVKNRNRWCAKCEKVNLNESYCRCIFESLLKSDFEKTRKVIPGRYELDGYSEKLKLAFEYHGEQHYKYVPRFKNSPEDIVDRRRIDRLKENLCIEHGIKLIVIPYTEAKNKLSLLSYIKSEFDKNKISYHDCEVDWSSSMASISKLDFAKNLANERGGKCLSTDYDNSSSKMLWECGRGHKWSACLASVQSLKTWCPYCMGMIVSTDDIKNLAINNGGKLVSPEYKGAFVKLQWSCKNGHIWWSTPDRIKQGSWCPKCKQCKKNNVKHNLKTFQQIASDRQGKCLSEHYEGFGKDLIFQCKNGHVWSARPYNILHRKTWCRKCVGMSRQKANRILK